MDLCTIEDAFPNIEPGSAHTKWKIGSGSGFPYVGGTDSTPSREERRAARKRAKKLKGPALAYSDSIQGDIPSTDPDRPAVKRMGDVETVQKEKEAFSAPPVLPKASCLFSDTGTPSYFGRWAEDVEENFSTYSAVPSDDSNYRLQPDFTKGSTLEGIQKAASAPLPEPELNDSWKPMTPAASYTAFLQASPEPRVAPAPEKLVEVDPDWATKGSAAKGPVGVNDYDNKYDSHTREEALIKRIDELVGRLDELEKKSVQDSQKEILLFVGTGLFLILSFEFMTRR